MVMVRMNRRPATGILLIPFLLLLVITVSASPVLPAEYYGQVTLNGNPAPVGTEISVTINNVVVGSIQTTAAGYYGGSGTFDPRLTVSGTADGQTLVFLINGNTADQTSVFHPGKTQQLSLSAVGTSKVTVTPTKTTTTVSPTKTTAVTATTTTVQQSVTTATVTTSAQANPTATGTVKSTKTIEKTTVQENNPIDTNAITASPTQAGEQKTMSSTLKSTPVQPVTTPQSATTQSSGFTIQTLVLSLLVITCWAIIRK
jgi:hypothetical protein